MLIYINQQLLNTPFYQGLNVSTGKMDRIP